jgi:DNA mismatch repair protein MutS
MSTTTVTGITTINEDKTDKIDYNSLTPMFRQFFDLKDRYPDCLLLFRCGDFYEMYGKDAVIGAKAMEIAITSREMGKGGRIEMAGVPYHALDNYLKLVIAKGIKVAVCEQMEDPKKTKGLVKRDVTKVITSGTILDPTMLAEDKNNYLMALASFAKQTGIAVADVSTGGLKVTSLVSSDIFKLKDEIFRIRPSEVIIDESLTASDVIKEYLFELEIPFSVSSEPVHGEISQEILKSVFADSVINSIKWSQVPESAMASAQLVNYLIETQKTTRHSLYSIEFYNPAEYMILDATTWRNLELTQTIMEHQKKGSLLWVLDETKTGMGARLLRSWLERPLIDPEKINARLNSVEELVNNYTLHDQVLGSLRSIHDLERITSRVIYGSANGRDLLALKNSLSHLPGLKQTLASAKSSMLVCLRESIDTLEDIHKLIDESIADDPPVGLKDGNLIKKGYNSDLDELRDIRTNAKKWIAQLENTEREKTGIKSLKVKFNNVFGYFIEITKSNLHLVPEEYQRRQTIVNGERFISPQLKEYEAKVLGAEEKIIDLEFNLFINIRDRIASESSRIQNTSHVIASIDVLNSLAAIAMKGRYCKPEIAREPVLSIKNGRHPVVEKVLKDGFVPNDTDTGSKKSNFHVITGPNMSGKSTYLRQIGLIAIMAQLGSFVPADYAKIGIVDRVFTRVGASDDLHLGKSTFLVEMSETANIINNASLRSLILLDEIGRGTSTYDGMSIAWSVSEYIHNHIGARTLFATHFHQLTELADLLEGVENYRVDVKESNKDIVFLHRIVPGGTDRSYGIYVAKLAGLPPVILKRAGEILDQLESSYDERKKNLGGNEKGENPAYQLTFFDMLNNPLLDELRGIDPDELSPKEALQKIYDLKRKIE